ncbi:hypothetical protein [Endozoicomonas ascidiicola]|uniref:hypothetical protein n=1 Tax=Endozoicomonas ascidiicola TaxID=1698521 RepID=UPI00082BBD6A|nr:hypothetical protein [Endozoicomonas ascidiicola]
MAEPTYDDPHHTEWIISIDHWHQVSIIKPPNIAQHFLEYHNAEEIGIECYLPDHPPGLYRMTCSFHESHDIESGQVDDYGFPLETLSPIMTTTDATLK